MSKIRLTPTERLKHVESFLNLACRETFKLHSAMANARDNASTPERFSELVRGVSEKDFPYWRDRLNYFFRAIRDVLPTYSRRVRRPRPSARRNRKAVVS